MSQSSESEPATATHPADASAARQLIVADLEQRIHDLERTPEDRFGRFTRLDWFFCVAGSVMLPVVLYLRFWP